MKRRFNILCCVVVGLAGCIDKPAPTGMLLDSSVDGQSVSYGPGQSFAIALDAHGSAGYQWDCTISDLAVVRLDSTGTRPKDNGGVMLGAPFVETFYFRTAAAGQCTIVLIEHRVWEKDTPPINAVRLVVNVFREVR